jgi:hypothetical protein
LIARPGRTTNPTIEHFGELSRNLLILVSSI